MNAQGHTRSLKVKVGNKRRNLIVDYRLRYLQFRH